MTHTVHPYAHRLGVIRDWKSRWFAKTPAQYRENVMVDSAIRRFLKKRLRGHYVTSVEIERNEKHIRVLIKTSRPGLVIGRGGEGSTKLTKEIEQVARKVPKAPKLSVRLDIEEVRSPESQSPVVAYMVAEGLEKRQTFRRVLKQTVEKVMANRDVQGVRIAIAGRLGGAEMSRQEEIKRGRVPLQTLRADIDFAREEAYLPYGVIGIKVWIYRGEIFDKDAKK
ncbi:30S ribosomal protein S3 [Candidatus Kaiserbacteria bacterium RIFCSPHIGHO2_02_FULL_59_21]|uniref:Small ribosomal subunit protein uS3 n=2 Tax=Candidatus Kaiseribacteriota TaxID=1752734 RepID=A0A0G2B0C6_9BACT|nr:MAG: 30S ribosomal protein S3 [Candidatus Kaiserbacteria bacterium GW2011_GWA2_58_9]OGG63310.1 MAG: 30S ribosomal protein S3 [Candidatus Kaiserbacteria bacterium RIFCSPHIGHO2_01_FULL_58_22]OGG66629.1 MAG: 30S ribosomal protein S3 [Candidatus Kaiserbacteria bacterium RIFCSPHIGHO2_02_FULL_59_21]OGG78996.1 MAG: 30S ribosomal protein S3 [Candidatus Kaiserbacteria bacterium RIFCSPLOWO2_01_FULL_59_34]OGG84380.1 MAG: 30S ribosomal protein S3 [Candidatus Kaiserbacteria bacterium RIFCSPLOWO2_02_FULL_